MIQDELKEAREKSGLSIYDLEEKTQIHHNTIYRMENKLNSPSLEVVDKVADALGYRLVLRKKANK